MTPYQLQHLIETAQQLSLARDLDSIMDIVRKAARNLTGADGATFVLKDRDLCYYAEEDAISPLWKGQRFPMTSCVSGWAMINKQPAIIEDIYADDRIPVEAYRPTFVKSLAMVPIRTIDPIGAIGNYWATRHTPTEEEVQILQSIADLTSVSVENLYAFDELKAQNKKLFEIAFLQSHQVRSVVTQIQGLYNVFNFENLSDPANAEVFQKLKQSADSVDNVVKEIVSKTHHIRVRE